MKKSHKVILIIFILIILIYFGFSFIVANQMTKRMAPRLDVSPTHVSKNYKDIEFKSTDDLTLKGWLFENNSEELVIMVPGLTQNRINTSYYAMSIGKDLVDQGYNLLMYDPRATGLSEGNRVSYGKLEVADIMGVVKFAKEYGFKPEKIAILGDSTGAISTLMAVKQLNDIGALIIDTATTNYKPFIIRRLWEEKKIPTFFASGIFLFTDAIFGLDIGTVKPIEKLSLVPDRRFLYLHAELDEIFPSTEGKKLLDASNPDSKLVVFPNAKHIETYKSDPNLYRKEVFSFLESELVE